MRSLTAARIDGPIMLGASTCVGDAVTLSGPASIGAQVVLHDGASVADSVLWDAAASGRARV